MIFVEFPAIFDYFHVYFATWSKYFATWDLFRGSGALPNEFSYSRPCLIPGMRPVVCDSIIPYIKNDDKCTSNVI